MKQKRKKKTVRRLLVIPIGLALLVVSAASCTARDAAVDLCLDNPARPPVIVKSGSTSWPGNNPVPDDSPVDLRAFARVALNLGMKIEVNSTNHTRDNLCLVGGTFSTAHDEEETPWERPANQQSDPHWHSNWGVVANSPNVQLIGQTVRNVGDAFGFHEPTAINWKIVGARVDGGTEYPAGAFIHDDCVENDTMQTGQIIDSKFDGCHVFLSAMHGWGPLPRPDGSANTISVVDTLVRLQPMKNSYCPVIDPTIGCQNGYGYWQHGGFFKYANSTAGDPQGDGQPPALSVTRSIFRVDQPAAYGGNSNGKLGLPPGTACDNVVLVGWEHLNTTERNSWIAACGAVGENIDENGTPNFQVGTTADWDQAVAIWDAAHPEPIPDPAP